MSNKSGGGASQRDSKNHWRASKSACSWWTLQSVEQERGAASERDFKTHRGTCSEAACLSVEQERGGASQRKFNNHRRGRGGTSDSTCSALP
jgi:hypothetical protein